MEKYNGSWVVGLHKTTVVTNCADLYERYIESGHADTEYYGGYLVAESIPPPFAQLIAAAPEMLQLLEEIAMQHAYWLPTDVARRIDDLISKAHVSRK